MKKNNSFLCWSSLFFIGLLWSACGTIRDTPKNVERHNLGYIKVAKSETTTSIGQWNRENLDNPSMSLADMLMRVPGVQVRGNGSNALITVRGISSFMANIEPLFVVDGMSVGFGYNSVSFLNPTEIDNISVLKDSGAAIYGVRGSNGVIIIETKGADPRNK